MRNLPEIMSARSMKIAISLPKTTLLEVESLRHKLKLARSQVFLEGISLWLRKKEEESWDRKYAKGYREKPEDSAELHPLFRAGLTSFSKDEW